MGLGWVRRSPVLNSLSLFDLMSGFYEPIRKTANQVVGLNAMQQNPFTSVFAGAASGAVGGCFFDPLYRARE
jgi:hypothetical protein